MAVNVSKVEKLVGTSGPISFSDIRNEFGGNTTNIRASLYKRNTGDDVDWDGPKASKIEPKIPDATENQDIGSESNWNVSALRNTVMEYNVTQSGDNEELAYFDSDTSTWNGNLSRNVLKKFNVTGTVYANEISKDALTFGGDLYNLEIEVDKDGKIYGEGGQQNVNLTSVSGSSNVVDNSGNISFGSISGIGVNLTRFEDENVVVRDRVSVPAISGSADVTDNGTEIGTVENVIDVTDNVSGATVSVERYVNTDKFNPNQLPQDAIVNKKLDVTDAQDTITFTRIEGKDISITRYDDRPSNTPDEPVPGISGTASVTDNKSRLSISSQIEGAKATVTRFNNGTDEDSWQKKEGETITVYDDMGSIAIEENELRGKNFLGVKLQVTRYVKPGSTGAGGHAIGNLLYYVDIKSESSTISAGAINPSVKGSTSTNKRASYNRFPEGSKPTYSGIKLSSGYPYKDPDTDNRWVFAFEMPNTEGGSGNQATFVYDFNVILKLPQVIGVGEGQGVGKLGYHVEFDDPLPSGATVSAAIVDTTTRASGYALTEVDDSIRLKRIRDVSNNRTKYEVTFEMPNSLTTGKQATFARSWSYSVDSPFVAGGSEGQKVGDFGYYVDIENIENFTLTGSIDDKTKRGSYPTSSASYSYDIKMSEGYPKKINDTRWAVAFDMKNSLNSDLRQATYARTWDLVLNAPEQEATTEDLPVGSLGYYVSVVGDTVLKITDPTIGATVVNKKLRASGLVDNGGTIRLAPGYPKPISDTLWDFAFDMANSVQSGRRQATLVRNFLVNVSADAISGGTEGYPPGSVGYYIDVTGAASNPVITASITDKNTRDDGSGAGNTIRLAPGYPKSITANRQAVAFQMSNSLTSGNQATFARSWSFDISTNIQSTVSGGGRGGDALYVNNTKTNSPVEIYAEGSIFAGGGSGTKGNAGSSGSTLSCSSTTTFTTTNDQTRKDTDGANLSDAMPGQTCRRSRRGSRWVSANPVASSIRSRCRGGGTRRGDGGDLHNGGNYICYRTWSVTCSQTTDYNKAGGNGGNGGSAGRGRGFSHQSGTLAGGGGNAGNTNSCSGGSSTGNSGNPGNSGGDWGKPGGGTAGIAIQKKNAVMASYTDKTVKGKIVNI